MNSAAVNVSDVAEHHTVVMYPSIGRLTPGGQIWKLHLHGVILEPSEIGLQNRILLRLLKRVMKVDPVQFESELFRQRVGCFVAAGDPGRQIVVRIGNRCYPLGHRSKRDGHFSGTVRLSIEAVRELEDCGIIENGWLAFEVVTQPGDPERFVGRCLLVEPQGTSVISDIDDTIKHTQVACRRSVLANTFLHEFRSIEGMAALYQQWAGQGATFHYVSSSPWQLFSPLRELCESAGFPDGTMHLRMFRLRDDMLRRMLLIRRHRKAAVIESLLRTFPGRRFVLVGDSGEQDPEIYAAVARMFPQQIERILIRQLSELSADDERISKLLRDVPDTRWQLFSDPSELAGQPIVTPEAAATQNWRSVLV